MTDFGVVKAANRPSEVAYVICGLLSLPFCIVVTQINNSLNFGTKV